MQQKLSDWQRVESVIEWANMTTNYFARHIGLSRGETLYQIKKGNNGISRNVAILITKKYPQINIVWLLTGYGEMFADEELSSAAKPFFDIGAEEHIREIDSLKPSEQMVLPSNIDCDFGIRYLGLAMGSKTPPNSVILLKKILPEMIIPGDECVIVTKNIVLLRIAKETKRDGKDNSIRFTAINSETYGDVEVTADELEALYKVNGKILINK